MSADDLAPIRARLAAVNQERWARNTEPAIDPRFPLGTFIAHAPTDIAALLSEVESLRAENEALRSERSAHIAVCPDCGEVTRSDEDRCCVSCGRDLIILADRHSADLLRSELTEAGDVLKAATTALECVSQGRIGDLIQIGGDTLKEWSDGRTE